MLTRSTTISLVYIALLPFRGYNALPTARQENQYDVGNLISNALSDFLSSRGVTDQFHTIPGGRAINWVGDTVDEDTTIYNRNRIIFNTADIVPSANDSKAPTHFSDAFSNFLFDLNVALDLNSSVAAEVNPEKDAASALATEKCGEVDRISKELKDKWRNEHNEGHRDEELTEQDLNQRLMRDFQYTDANRACVAAKATNSAVGNADSSPNWNLFRTAYNNVKPLVDSVSLSVEGITMPLSKDADSNAGAVPGEGNSVPLYEFPALESTVTGWQGRSDDAEPEFRWDSTTSRIRTSEELSEGHGSLGVSYGPFSGSTDITVSDSDDTHSVKAQTMTIQIGALDLVPINHGTWFDQYRAASALQSTQDEKEQVAQPLIAQHFGTKENPRPAAYFNDQALVAYQVSWSLTFSSSEEAKSYMERSIEAEASFLWISASGGEKKISGYATLSSDSLTVEYKPTNKNALIIGYLVGTYFS